MSRRLSSSRNRPPTSTRPISSHKPSGYDDEIVKGRKKVISPLEHAADFLSQYCKNNNDNNPKPEHIIKNVKQTIMNIVLCFFFFSFLVPTDFRKSATRGSNESQRCKSRARLSSRSYH